MDGLVMWELRLVVKYNVNNMINTLIAIVTTVF